MRADYHVHTEFSDDSDYDMEKVVEDAIMLGLDEICFTDHVDYGIKKDWDEPEHLGAFIDETRLELKALGFKEFCTFDKMRPVYHQL